MQFMVIERFADSDMLPIYQRLQDEGRGLPADVSFIDSWVEVGFARCFQLMECDDLMALQRWVLHWRGLKAAFEIVPVIKGEDTAALFAPLLETQQAASTNENAA